MGATEDPDDDEEPIARARVCKFLKDRRRVVDFGFREEFWDEMCVVVEDRRKPSKASERMVKGAFDRVSNASTRVVKSGLDRANESILRDL